jgi:hypothetical protein
MMMLLYCCIGKNIMRTGVAETLLTGLGGCSPLPLRYKKQFGKHQKSKTMTPERENGNNVTKQHGKFHYSYGS